MRTELRSVRRDARIALGSAAAGNGHLPADWEEKYTDAVRGRCDLELLVQLTNRAADLIAQESMDAWLAPRLHCALRIPRSAAVDEGMWMWLALHCHRFVKARFADQGGRLNPWRLHGVWSRNALSRLWWGAEMTRNGASYVATSLCFSRVRTAQFALELLYSHDRAAAIAFTTAIELPPKGHRLSDDYMKELSKRLRVYLTLRGLGGFGEAVPDEGADYDAEWASHSPSLKSLLVADINALKGPSTGHCSQRRIQDLTEWFNGIVEEVQLGSQG